MHDQSLKSAHILIVDDQEANIKLLVDFLKFQGYSNIKSTLDPRDVAGLISTFKPDLILLDLLMPHLTGFQIMEQLGAIEHANPYLPVLVLTADVTSETKLRALSVGASDFISKPFDLIEVGLRIKNLLRISILQQQLLDQKMTLEEKVVERTLELTEANASLLAAKEKAEESNLLKSAFINNISHEIRTPLNGIVGFGQLLVDPTATEAERREYIEQLQLSSERLIDTVTDFIDISLLSSGNQNIMKTDFHPSEVLQDLIKRYNEPCEKKNLRIALELPPASEEVVMYSDREMLSKCINHLISNALKFTESGSIDFGFLTNNEQIEFFVRDTGKGIPDELVEGIFDKFSQVENANSRGHEGSGLGLAIVKGMITLLDGMVRVTSTLKKGSTFFLTLPLTGQKLPHSEKSINLPPKRESGEQTLLIAEDDDINFFYVTTVLKLQKTLTILRASNGNKAVELCRKNPEIDLVMMDLKMNDKNGFDAAREIKKFRPKLNIIAVTAYSGSEERKRAMESGCDDFMTKPFKKNVLIETLKKFSIVIDQA